MKKKLGRNEPCWCGSGKKYKKCHLSRHLDKPMQPWEVEEKLQKLFSSKYCLCPNSMKLGCTREIIKAHTVSKSSSLKTIARNGHVYGLKPSLQKLSENNGVFQPELIGVNRASTFTGFCKAHDKDLFSAFEDKPFTGTEEQSFLVGYRSLSREYFTKMSQHALQGTYKELDKGKTELDQQIIQNFFSIHSTGVDLGLRDTKIHKRSYDDILVSGNFHEAKSHIIEFSELLPLACSGAFFPEQDFDGKLLQDFSAQKKVLDLLCFSILSSEKRSYAVFTWLEGSDISCSKFIDSLNKINNERLFSVLAQFACMTFENIYFSPDWWENLTSAIQKEITKWLLYGASFMPKSSFLVDAGIELGQYTISKR